MSQQASLHIVLLLLFSLGAAVSGQTTQQPQCSNSSSFPTQAAVAKLSENFGGLDGFYSIATGIADGLHGELSHDLMKKFADVVQGNDDDVSGLVSDLLKNQAGFIIFVVIGLLFVVIFPITGCCYCCCRCCCSKCGATRYQKEEASTNCLLVLLAILIISFAFILTGTIIYGATLQDISEKIPLAKQGVTNVLQTPDIKTTADKTNGLVDKARQDVHNQLGAVTMQVNKAKDNVNQVIDQLNNLTTKADGYVTNATNAIDDAHTSYNDYGGKNSIVAGISVIVLLPCSIALILIAAGLACGAAGYRNKRFPPQRTTLSHTAGYVAIATCIFLFCIGGFLMFLSTTLFTAGYALQFACTPLFYDNTYEVFEFIDEKIPDVTNPIDGNVVPVSIKNAIIGCEQSKTVYAAVDGDKIFQVDQILGNVTFDTSAIDAHVNPGLSPTLSDTDKQAIDFLASQFNPTPTTTQSLLLRVVVALDELQADLQTCSSDLANQAKNFNTDANSIDSWVAIVSSNVNEMTTALNYINQSNADQAVHAVQNYSLHLFNDLNVTAYASFGQLQTNLRDNIANCRPLYDTWQNVGTLVCKKLGHPLQGLWASLGMTVLFFIPMIILLTLISKYLYRMDREHYPLLTGGSVSIGRLDRVSPEVIEY
uniref:Uncharacterized protein n=1 Tax=Plectus sambesii TaxID=2011161 RepID=A0A914W845_9BILA